MLTARLERYQGRLPLVVTSVEPCLDVIRLVVELDGRTHRLAGLDTYWLAGDTYGGAVDPDNLERYGGKAAVAYRWDEDGHVELLDAAPPADAIVTRGVLMPDDEARAEGLLP